MANDEFIGVLPAYERDLLRDLRATGMSDEAIGTLWLSRAGSKNTVGFGAVTDAQSFYASLEKEVRRLICGDPDYEDVRKQAAAVWNTSKLGVVSAVAAVVGSNIGIAVAAVIPVVALILNTVANTGVNAWCKTSPE